MKKCKHDIQSFNTYAGQANIKMLVAWLLLFGLFPISGYCQDDSRKEFSNVICDYYLPINKNGLSITSFNVTSKIRIERWEKNAQIILDIEKSQGTASNPDPKFKYSYNYMGKQYGDQHVGKDPFESITTENLTYEVMVSYGDKIFGWKKVDGKTNFFGPIEKDAKASGVMVNVRIVGLMFRGTNEIENKIRGLLQGNTTGTSASSNPLNNNSIQANNSNESAQTRNAQQQSQQQQNGTANLNNTRSNAGSSNNAGSTSNAKPTTPGPITNMSNYVGIEGSKESMQVYQQDGKYYVKSQNGTVTPITKQYFDNVTAIGSKNAQIEADLKKTLNTPISNYNSETNTYSNPLPSYSSSFGTKSSFQKGYETGQQIADVATPIVSGLANLVQANRIKKNEEAARNNQAREDNRHQFTDDCLNKSYYLRTWQGFNDYVVKQIPYLLAQPSPSRETLLGSPKYATVFGKDVNYIIKNYKAQWEGNKKIKKDVARGDLQFFKSNSDFLSDFYNAYSSTDYNIDYNYNNVLLKKKDCNFIFDENDIVIGIKIEVAASDGDHDMRRLEDIINKTGHNYIQVDGGTSNCFLLKDKLIIFDYDDISMFDMNYFYDRIWIKFPDEYLNIYKLSNEQFKPNFAGISFRKADESSAIQNKKKLQTGWRADDLNKIKFESLVTSEKGIIIDKVMQGSIADKAGLKDGDIITEFRGEKVVMPYMFQLMMVGYAPEGRISVSYLRAGQEFITAFVYNSNNGEKKSTLSASSSGNPPKKTNKKPVVKPAVKKHQ